MKESLAFSDNALQNSVGWNDAKALLSDDFEAVWPQSREKMNRDGFIAVHRNYPGTHQIQVLDVLYNMAVGATTLKLSRRCTWNPKYPMEND